MNMRGLPAIQYFVSGGQIDKIYQDLFGRAPDEGGKSFYQDLLAGRSLSDAYAIIGGGATGEDALKAPPEKIAEKTVEAAYRQELGRAPDPEGKQNYIEQALQGNVSLTDLDSIFRSSPEFTSKTEFINLPSTVGGATTETSMANATPIGPGITPTKVTQPPVKTLTPLEQLYFDILGRAGDASGLGYYGPKFGDVIDASERELFIRNAVKSGELTQAQADALLGTTTGAPVDAPTAARPEDMLNRLLYQPILGRTGEPGGMDFYQQQFLGEGDTTISPAEREQFIRSAVQSGELSQRAADAYLGTIPGLPSFLPAGAAAVGRVDPNFLRTAAPAIATNPITGQPQLQGPTSLIQGTTPVAPPVAGMAEGGNVETAGSRALTPAELGSEFDRSQFTDERGQLISGYSRPIRDQYGTIIGYEDRPYERDVVFGEELRRRQAAALPDTEQAMLDMLARQGRTGVNPMTGGLAGIQVGGPMMRNMPQYYSTIEAGRRYRGFAKGGLADVAQELASKGRGGDTMLVHMAPHEVAGLNAIARMQGTELTINPETGMPEALKLGKLFKQLAPMALGFALGPAGAGIFSSALGAGLAVGAGYTLATGSLQQGIAAGLGAYGGSNLATGLQAAGADAAASSAATQAGGSGIGSGAGGAAAEAAMVNPMAPVDYSLAAAPPPTPTSISLTGGTGSGISLAPGPTGFTAAGPAIPGSEQLFTQQVPIESVNLATGAREAAMSTVPRTSSVLASDVTGLGSTPTPGSALTGAERYFGDKATSDLAAQRYADATGSTLGTSAMQVVGGAAAQSAAEQEAAIKAKQAAISREEDEKKRLYDALFRRTLGAVPAKSGGLMKLAGGGMTYMEAGGTTGPTGAPRDVSGTGDGMSDSVPATIEGVQEARLADGEFVIPADVVADIGNGSSDAGSKKLYDMMDRIRMARHGTTEQPPEIKAERLMPA